MFITTSEIVKATFQNILFPHIDVENNQKCGKAATFYLSTVESWSKSSGIFFNSPESLKKTRFILS
jgi:hypothetical protein